MRVDARGAVTDHKYAVHPRTMEIQAYLERSMDSDGALFYGHIQA